MAASPDYMVDIETEEEAMVSRIEEEPIETEEPTVEDFLEAFENSSFFKKGHFTCAISQALMLDPVVLNGSGQTVDRSSAIQLIASAVQDGKEPICPITQKELLITVSRGELPKLSQPESYFVDNAALKSLIGESIQEFKNSQGDKYQNVPDPMIKPREKSKSVELVSPSSTTENDDAQNSPTNRNRFFTEECQRAAMVCMIPITFSSSSIGTASIRSMLFPQTISCLQAILMCSGSILCCVGTLMASSAALELGGRVEAWYRRDEEQENVAAEVAAQPLVMQEGEGENGIEMQVITSFPEQNNGNGGGPVSMFMVEGDAEPNLVSSASRFSPSRG